MNAERLIELVRQNALLYDLRNPYYLNSKKKNIIWDNIGKELKCEEQIREETAEAGTTNENILQQVMSNLKQEQKRTALATNTSVITVRRITTQAANSESLTLGQNMVQPRALKRLFLRDNVWSSYMLDPGFVPNALLTFKPGGKSGDYHDNMNYKHYEKWLKTQLIPNTPPNSVVVVDIAAYHSKQYAPTSITRKADKQAWLSEKGIEYDDDMLKPQLYQLIKMPDE
ncbi:unnamed protein product [Colias eurytheme]|nr:unnamed protein product [Colias eurytheme]